MAMVHLRKNELFGMDLSSMGLYRLIHEHPGHLRPWEMSWNRAGKCVENGQKNGWNMGRIELGMTRGKAGKCWIRVFDRNPAEFRCSNC